MSLFAIVMELVQLPFDMYSEHISTKYGRSVQTWASWFGDWGKGLLLACIFASILGWILYARATPQPPSLVVLLLAGADPNRDFRDVHCAGLD